MADTLVTIAQVKTRLFPAGAADATDDALLTELVEQLSDWIEDYTHRKFIAVASTTYTFDTRSGYVLRIPIGVRTITLLEVNNLSHQPDSGGSYTTVPAADYLLRPKTQDAGIGWPYTEVRIARAATGTIRYFRDIENGARVTGTFGFASVPPAIQAVAIDAVVAAYNTRKGGASGVMGADDTTITPWNTFFTKGSPQRATLDRFRYVNVL